MIGTAFGMGVVAGIAAERAKDAYDKGLPLGEGARHVGAGLLAPVTRSLRTLRWLFAPATLGEDLPAPPPPKPPSITIIQLPKAALDRALSRAQAMTPLED